MEWTEVSDLNALAGVMDSKSSATAKLVYGSIVESVMVAAEAGALNEAAWRAGLEIT